MAEKTHNAITMDDLVALGDAWVEVVDGRLVEIDMSAGLFHNQVVVNAEMILRQFVREHKLGSVHTDGLTYVLETDEEGVQNTRLPDVSFLKRGRITAETDILKPFDGAPDLAVEVTSPGQSADSLRGRIRDYLENGTEEVWVLYVATKEVYQYTSHAPNRPTIYGEGDTFTSESLFPGLTVSVAALFDLSELYE